MQRAPLKRKRTAKKTARRDTVLVFVGGDDAHSDISSLDGTLRLSYAQKFELICQLSLFAYQLKNNTENVPRFLRTTACIRKA
jgi:hypothetical protein